MKHKAFFKALCLMALAIWNFGCENDGDQLEPLTPKVTLEKGTCKATSLTVKVTPSDATSCTVIALETEAGIPSTDDILQNGKNTAADKMSEVTFDKLQPKTEYNIFAVAANDTKFSEIVKVTMETLEKEDPGTKPDPDDKLYEMTPKIITGDYLGVGGFDGSHEYYTTITDAEFDEQGGAVSGGIVMELDIYAAASKNPTNPILASGTYEIDQEEKWLDKTIDAQSIYSRVFRLAEDGSIIGDPINYTSGKLEVNYDEKSATYDISGDFILEDKTHIVLTYKGSVEYANETGSSGEDVTMGTPHIVEATYYGAGTGDEEGLGVYYLELTDAQLDDQGYPTTAGHHIYIKLFNEIDYDTNTSIPAGQYTIPQDDNPTILSMCSDVTRYEEYGNEVRWTFLPSSTIDVSYSGDICTIKGSMLNDDGTKIIFTYTGEIKVKNLAQFPVGNVTDAVFERGEAVHKYLMGTELEKYTMTFEDKDTGVTASIIMYDNKSDNPTVKEISTGTYTATPYADEDATAQHLTFQLGDDPLLTWYYGSYGFRYNYANGMKTAAKVTGGTIEVSETPNGMKFDLKLTTIDGAFEGVYEGEVPFYEEGTPDPIGDLDLTLTGIHRQYDNSSTDPSNFYLELVDDAYTESKGMDGHMVVMDLYCAAGVTTLASGTYPLSDEVQAGTCKNPATFVRIFKSGNTTDVTFKSGEIQVTYDETTSNYDITMNMITARQEIIKCKFTGKITFPSPQSMSKKAIPILYKDTE